MIGIIGMCSKYSINRLKIGLILAFISLQACIQNVSLSISDGGSLTVLSSLIYEECTRANFDQYSDGYTDDIRAPTGEIAKVPEYKIFLCGTGSMSDPYRIGYKNGLRFLMGHGVGFSKPDEKLLQLKGKSYKDFLMGAYSFKLIGFKETLLDFTQIDKIPLHTNFFSPIGNEETPFSGNFDGNGVVIKNLFVTGADNIGLFGVTKDANLINVHVQNIQVAGNRAVGGLVGLARNTSITNSYVSWDGNISLSQVGGDENVGGLVGLSEDTRILNSYSFNVVRGIKNLGGLVGKNKVVVSELSLNSATIRYSFSRSVVLPIVRTGVPILAVGGLVGDNEGSISDTYSFSVLHASFQKNTLGGLIGVNSGSLTNRNYFYSNYLSCIGNSVGVLVENLRESCVSLGNYSDFSIERNFNFTNNYIVEAGRQSPLLQYDCLRTLPKINKNQYSCGETLAIPDAPLVNTAPPTSFLVSSSSADSMNLQWGNVGDVERYQLLVSGEHSNQVFWFESLSRDKLTYTYPNPIPGLSYKFSVRSCNVYGACGNWSTLLASIPSVIKVSSKGTDIEPDTSGRYPIYNYNQFLIRWTAQPNVQNYIVKEKNAGGVVLNTYTLASSQNSHPITKAVPAVSRTQTDYDYEITCTSTDPNSCTNSIGTLAVSIKNTPPTNISISDFIDSLVYSPTPTLSWDAVPQVNHYEYTRNNGTTVQNSNNLNSVVLNGLTIGNHTYRVRACGSVDSSSCSSWSDGITFSLFTLDVDGDGLIEIYTAEQLNYIRYNLSGTSRKTSDGDVGLTIGCPALGCRGYELVADIDLGNTRWGSAYAGADKVADGWVPIGTCGLDNDCEQAAGNLPFAGIFEGNGHVIKNLYIKRPTQNGVGLFALASSERIVELFLHDVAVFGGNFVGALVGQFATSEVGSNINKIRATGFVSGSENVGGLLGATNRTIFSSWSTVSVLGILRVGGLVGVQQGADDVNIHIVNSHAVASVTGQSNVGGLVGRKVNGHITDSYAKGTISGSILTGGLAGYTNNVTIQDSYATGDVTSLALSGDFIGGLLGFSENDSVINNSYATGAVSAPNLLSVGGLVGYGNSIEITNSYATGSVSGGAQVGGLVGYHVGAKSIRTSYATGSVSGSTQVGGLVGFGRSTLISLNSYATGSVSGTSQVGGLVGLLNLSGSIQNSRATGTVTGNGSGNGIGGLIGEIADSGIISNSHATGAVSASNSSRVGGLVGYAVSSTITNSYATGVISGLNGVGGLIGVSSGASISTPITISSNSYATGSVSGTDQVGGLIGDQLEGGHIVGSYATGSVSGRHDVGGLCGRTNIGTLTANLRDSYATGAVSATGSNVGGLVGSQNIIIRQSSATGTVSATGDGGDAIGGLVGTQNALIQNSYATGSVSGTNKFKVGGLVGISIGVIRNSYATGTVSLTTSLPAGSIGGLVGHQQANIINCYARGSVTLSSLITSFNEGVSAGALVGYRSGSPEIRNTYATGLITSNVGFKGGILGLGAIGSSSDTSNSMKNYWDSSTTGTSSTDLGFGTGLSTSNMKTASEGSNISNLGNCFKFVEGQYPQLYSSSAAGTCTLKQLLGGQ